jgi:hypothetical protein
MKKVMLAAAVAALAAPATFVSPAAAKAPAKASAGAACAVAPYAFNALSRLTSSAVARGTAGDVSREPTTSDINEEVPASAQGRGGKRFRATVDVYYHVVYDPAIPASNVSDTAIAAQTTALNMGFGGFEGGVDTGFRFRTAGVDRTANADWHNEGIGSPAERAMKKATHQGDASDLNFWVTTAEAYLGWAYFPSNYKTHPWRDGLVVDWESLPGTSTRYAGAYDLGKTGTHEAGHWFGLDHVFNGGCNNWGDHVADTPPQLIATRGCPEGQDSCKEPGLDSIHNYMDYSFDSCYNQFTAGQAARAQDQWLYYRANGGDTAGN